MSQNIKQKKLLKPIPYPDIYLTEQLRSKLEKKHFPKPNVPSASQGLLLKLFPKYYKSLKIPSKSVNWSVLKKIKNIKALHHLELEDDNDVEKQKKSAKHIRNCLLNKRKTLKSMPIVEIQSIFFSRIKIVDLSSEWKYGLIRHKNDSERKIWSFYKRFWMFRLKLEHVEVYCRDPSLWVKLREFKKTNKTPSKNYALIFEDGEKENVLSTKKTIEGLQKSPSLLSHIVHSNLKKDSVASLDPILTSFLQSCSTLSQLSFQINKKSEMLPALETFENLKALTLKVSDRDAFFDHIEFPTSLETLSLTLYLRRYNHLTRADRLQLQKTGPASVCNKYPERFFETWKNLTQLKTLELHLYNINESDTCSQGFLPSLLKGACNIETLVLKFSFSYDWMSKIQLAPILDALAHCKSLKTVKILEVVKKPATRKNLTFDVPYDLQKFPQLSHITSFNMDNIIQEDTCLNDFIRGFLSDSKQDKNVSFGEIKLSSNQSLIELFQTLNNSHGSAQHNLSLKVHVCLNRMKDLLQNFESPPSLLCQKISLEIAIDFRAEAIVIPNDDKGIIDQVQRVFPGFNVTVPLNRDKFILRNFSL